MAEPFLDLTTYTDGIRAGWKTGDVYRLIIREAPRLFHASSREQQRRILGRRPPLTGTPWDAFLAATVEHVAVLHGHRPPEWVEEPERFLDPPWMPTKNRHARAEAFGYAPAAFIRHGALPDPADLDQRGGERHAWTPRP